MLNEYYRSAFGVSETLAAQRLELQQAALPLARELPREPGEDFSTLEFDNSRGEFIVRVADPAAEKAAGRVLDENGVRSSSVESVGYNAADLDAVVSRLSEALQPLLRQGTASVGIESGAPFVEHAPRVGPRVRALVQEAEAPRVPVRVVEAPAASLRYRASQSGCISSWATCKDGLLVGGTNWLAPDTLPWHCSLGFPGRLANGTKVFTTAGHCTQSYPAGTPFLAEYWADPPSVNGMQSAGLMNPAAGHYGAWGDFGMLIPFVGGGAKWKWAPFMALWDKNATAFQDDFTLLPVDASFNTQPPVGIAICGSGAVYLKAGCGTITQTNVSRSYGGPVVNGQMTVENGNVYVGYPGDSGGPWVFYFNGIFVATAMTSAGSLSGGEVLVQPIHSAAAAMGVTIP